MQIKKQTGFTLVELLVALSLGVLLLGIVITIYLGSKATFSAATGVARSQESTRFATHFMKQDIRMSGYVACSEGVSTRKVVDDDDETFPASLQNAIFGWEYNGTDVGNNYTLDYEQLDKTFTQADLDNARTSNRGAPGDWTGNYIQGEPGTPVVLNLPAQLAGLSPMQGSDIFMVSISNPLQILPERQVNQRNPEINVTDLEENSVGSGVETGSILKVGDCSAIDTFQNMAGPNDAFVSAQGTGVQPGNKLTGVFKWQKKWDQSANIYQTTTSVYYIGTGAGGKPSLFRFRTTCGLNAACGAATAELVEGVENMQVLYGEDADSDGAADIFISADSVVDFRDIVSVKVGLLVRSPDAGLDTNDDVFETIDVLDQVTIDPPDDQFQRFVNNMTVRIHNRGL